MEMSLPGDPATLGQCGSVKKESHDMGDISFMDSIILPCNCPCPGEAVAPWEAGLGKDTATQPLETAAPPREGTTYSYVEIKKNGWSPTINRLSLHCLTRRL